MKLLFLLILIVGIGSVIYLYIAKSSKRKQKKQFDWKPVYVSVAFVTILLSLLVFGLYSSAHQPDTQCSAKHVTASLLPTHLQTAMDYFNQGNYDYDAGNCLQAIKDYSKSLALNPNYPESYNNRAYTYMRLRNYQAALQDLDSAIALNPNYVQALMNRGDIHNYYYQIDRAAAIADYKRVIALTNQSDRQQTSVCGHLFLAKHNGWNLGTFLDMLVGNGYSCRL